MIFLFKKFCGKNKKLGPQEVAQSARGDLCFMKRGPSLNLSFPLLLGPITYQKKKIRKVRASISRKSTLILGHPRKERWTLKLGRSTFFLIIVSMREMSLQFCSINSILGILFGFF